MFNIGDVVMVKACKDLEPVKAKIIDMGPDENDKIWYMCEPIEFEAFAREFTADCLTLVK